MGNSPLVAAGEVSRFRAATVGGTGGAGAAPKAS